MDDILDSLSKKGRKFKHLLKGKGHKSDSTGANTTGESAGSSGSLLRPEPHVVAGGRDGEGKRTSTDVQQDRSRDGSPQPEPMPAGESDGGRQRGEAGVDGKGERVMDGGVSREVERVYPSPSTGEPDST